MDHHGTEAGPQQWKSSTECRSGISCVRKCLSAHLLRNSIGYPLLIVISHFTLVGWQSVNAILYAGLPPLHTHSAIRRYGTDICVLLYVARLLFHYSVTALIPQSLQLQGAGNVSEPRLMSQVRKVREVACA